MEKVLVAGASGYLGRYIVKALKKKEYWVRGLARDSKKLDTLTGCIDDVFIAEVTIPESLTGICIGVDCVISTVGITKQKDGMTYMDVDYQANMNLLKEAKRSRVKKFIYVSVFNAEKMKDLKAVQAKLKFENELKKSGLDYTIVYPNGFFSDMLDYLEMARKGKGFVFGSGEYKINPIHGEDLARVCVSAIIGSDGIIEVGGPDLLTHN